MYITNKPEVAKIAEQNDVDWVFVDLEVRGKSNRQFGRNTVISAHTIDDVRNVRMVLSKSQLLVRINPIWPGSKEEIDDVIAAGANVIMLPYFKTIQEARTFISFVDNRVKTCLLVETPEAIGIIGDVLRPLAPDYVHIGLNDLHIAYDMKFIFELLADGTIDDLSKKISSFNVPFGFGGISRIGSKIPPAEHIIAEHYRLGSSMVILSRSFCNSDIYGIEEVQNIFQIEIPKIREVEQELALMPESFFERNRLVVKDEISKVVKNGETN